MAYWVQETGSHHNHRNYRNFICDYRTDIAKLPKQNTYGAKQEGDTVSSMPVDAGSDCLCLEDSSVWILGKDTDEWREI